MKTILILSLSLLVFSQPFHWTAVTTGVEARLRGVSAVSDRVAWASGTNGTVLRTTDGGVSWHRLTIPGSEKLDFRDIDAVDERTAYALSIGPGELSRIYKTTDAGLTWTEQFVNRDPKAFYDAMAFWDGQRGVAVSDSVDGQFVVLTTRDGGASWTRVPSAGLPAALPNEGFFAASGTNVTVAAPNHVWLGTGAASEARVLHSSDGGRTWVVSKTPLAAGPSAGIFSDRVLRYQARHRRRWRLQGGVRGQRQRRHHERWWSDVDTGEGSDGIPIGGRLSARRCGDDCRRRSIRDRRVKGWRRDLERDSRARLSRFQFRAEGPYWIWGRGEGIRRAPQSLKNKPPTIQPRLSSVRLSAPAPDQSARGDRSGSL